MSKNTLNLAIALAGIATACQTGQKEKIKENDNTSDKPNIVLIVSDDHGRGDAGCYGNKAIKTPNIDYLATEGIKFNNAYCTSASCSASRSVILTGMYNHATGQYGHTHQYHHFSAYDNVKSLPVFLEEQAGYKTARIGKYHVAPESVFRFQTILEANSRNAVAMADSCRSFINNNTNNPFFLYFCTSDPHRGGGRVEDNPLKPDRFGNKDEGYPGVETVTFSPDEVDVPDFLPDNAACRAELAQYYQSVARFDQGLGKLFNYLKDAKIWDNTVVIYISDNGIAFQGSKTNTYEPAINLPCIIKNVRSANKNKTSDAYINYTDLTPTLLDFAGVLKKCQSLLKKQAEDAEKAWTSHPVNGHFHGKSFKKVLETLDAGDRHETYASHTFHEITMYYPMRVAITGQYKLIWNIAWQLPYPHASYLWQSATWQSVLHSENQQYGQKTVESLTHRPQFELYDLQKDPGEIKNLADDPRYADVLKKMKTKLKHFQQKTNDPWFLKWEYE